MSKHPQNGILGGAESSQTFLTICVSFENRVLITDRGLKAASWT